MEASAAVVVDGSEVEAIGLWWWLLDTVAY